MELVKLMNGGSHRGIFNYLAPHSENTFESWVGLIEYAKDLLSNSARLLKHPFRSNVNYRTTILQLSH